jgi:hypothetical protein
MNQLINIVIFLYLFGLGLLPMILDMVDEAKEVRNNKKGVAHG